MCGRTCLVGAQAPVLILLPTVPEVSPPTVSWWEAGTPGTWPGLGGSELPFCFPLCLCCLVSHTVHVFVFCPRAPLRSGMPEGAQQERSPWRKGAWGMFHPPSCGSSILGGFCTLLGRGRLIKVGLLSRVATPIMSPYYFAFLFFPVSSSSAPWDHLRNKLPTPKFLSQVMLLGEPKLRKHSFFLSAFRTFFTYSFFKFGWKVVW